MPEKKELIAHILHQAKEQKWPYPKTFQALADAGVSSYQVSWGKVYEATYLGTFGKWKESLAGFKSMGTAEHFSESDLKNALKIHQKGQTSYLEFLRDAANSGVSHYRVDMHKRTVTYYDTNEQHSYQELVP